jgi:hypothetical protein
MIDALETLKAELDEGVALLRPHYPEETDVQLRDHALYLRSERYARGRWPSDDEIMERKAKAADEAAAEMRRELVRQSPGANNNELLRS